MKNLFLLILLFLCGHTALLAQQFTKEEAKVWELTQQLRKAMLDGDRKSLESLTAKELTYGHSSGKMEDKDAFVEALVSRKSHFTRIELSEPVITIVNNTALVRHRLEGDLLEEGKTRATSLGVLLVWTKQKDGWKLLARQAFKL
jgi:ketosteroid isomerase-like protein